MRSFFQLGYTLAGPGCGLLALGSLFGIFGLGGMASSGERGALPYVVGGLVLGLAGLYVVEWGRFTLPIPSRHGLRVRLQGTPEELRTRVLELTARDDLAETGLKKAERSFAWGCLPLVLAGGAGIWAANAVDPWFPLARGLAFLLLAGTAGMWLYALGLKVLHGRHDVDDGKLATVRTILELLSPDLPAGGTVALEASLGTPAYGVRATERGFGRLVEAYEDQWFHLGARLLDGSSLRLSLRGTGKRRVKFKRKRKRTKVRQGPATVSNELKLLLRVDPQRYPGLEGLAERLVLPQGLRAAQVKGVQTTDREIRATVLDHWSPSTGRGVLLPLVWLYRGLNALRA